MARQQVFEAVEHDVVRALGRAEVGRERRAGPAARARARQQRALEGREVAETDEFRAALHGLGHGRVIDLRQQPAQAVAAARDQRHIGAAGGRAVDGRQARGIVARKAHMGGQRVGVDFDFMAQGLEPRNAALERRLVAHGARRRVDVDVARALCMRMAAAGAVGVVHMVRMAVITVTMVVRGIGAALRRMGLAGLGQDDGDDFLVFLGGRRRRQGIQAAMQPAPVNHGQGAAENVLTI
ncbi:hypothetical protein D3C78_733550 [compost metagenome]